LSGSLLLATLVAVVIGYFLGSFPIAALLSRRAGVDIFEVGTGLPGASNVMRNVGRAPAVLVLLGDMAKGALAVVIGKYLGVEAPLLVLPAGAAVLGHWRSIFSRFRGGDGLATLGGAIVALFPIFGVIAVAVAMVVSLGGQKLPYTSLLGIVFGYGTLALLNVAFDGRSVDFMGIVDEGNTVTALGIGGVSALVLAHAINGHRRRRSTVEAESLDEMRAPDNRGPRPS
jgi:glycerol-3-phosphate acyltransferase PlsY